MQNGTPKFNALALAEGTFNFMGPGAHLTGKAAFVNTRTGHTHGWTEGSGAIWSKATMDALGKLREAMESDLAQAHLVGGSSFDEPGTNRESSIAEPTGGLGEHLGTNGEDAPPL